MLRITVWTRPWRDWFLTSTLMTLWSEVRLTLRRLSRTKVPASRVRSISWPLVGWGWMMSALTQAATTGASWVKADSSAARLPSWPAGKAVNPPIDKHNLIAVALPG